MHGIGKRFVYILRSDADPDRHYVGITADPDRRLEWHDHGPCGQTVRHRPWSFVVVMEFPAERAGGAVRAVPEDRLRPRLRNASLRRRRNRSGLTGHLSCGAGDVDVRRNAAATTRACRPSVSTAVTAACSLATIQ